MKPFQPTKEDLKRFLDDVLYVKTYLQADVDEVLDVYYAYLAVRQAGF